MMLLTYYNVICFFSGYIAPEYAAHGRISEKTDVYSFGVVVLEIMSGKKNMGYPRYDLNLIEYVSIGRFYEHHTLIPIPHASLLHIIDIEECKVLYNQIKLSYARQSSSAEDVISFLIFSYDWIADDSRSRRAKLIS